MQASGESTATFPSRGELLGVAAVTVLGSLIRVHYLSQEIRMDEAITYFQYVDRPGLTGLLDFSGLNNHLLHTLCAILGTKVFGNALWALRLPALVAGIAILPLTWLAMRRHYGAGAGLLGAGLAAGSPLLILFSTNARGYTLQTALFLGLLALAPRLVRCRRPGPWIGFVLLTGLLFYSLPSSVYVFGGVALWLGGSILLEPGVPDRRRMLGRAALAIAAGAVLTVALYAPTLLHTGLEHLPRFVRDPGEGEVEKVVSEGGLAAYLTHARVLRERWESGLPEWLGWVLLAGIAVAVLLHRRVSRNRVPVWLAVALWTGPLFLWQGVHAPHRTWLFLLPLYFGVAGAGISFGLRLAARGRSRVATIAAAAVAVLLAGGLSFEELRAGTVLVSRESGLFPGTLEIVDRLEGELSGRDLVLPGHARPVFTYYWIRRGIPLRYLQPEVAEAAAGADRLFVCVDATPRSGREEQVENILRTHDQRLRSLEEALRRARIRREEFGEPRLIQESGCYRLYLLERVAPSRSRRR
jgi:hypothetical protein